MSTADHLLLPEQIVQDAFHSYLKSSLTHARLERLLDADVLSSAEGDLMVTGPALCLYFAALRSTTDPPSVPLPRSVTSSSGLQPLDLSYNNCPPPFVPFLRVWAGFVPLIQSLPPEHQHDLARVICGLAPLSEPPNPHLDGISTGLRGVAIEISQRRTFQDRYASDLQAALDFGGTTNRRASFVPPPSYETSASSSTFLDPTTAGLAPGSPVSTPSASRRYSPTSPSILNTTSSPLDLIRETLYASLGDVFERTPFIHTLLKSDPPRAYFASLGLAILDIATRSIILPGTSDSNEVIIVGVLGNSLSFDQFPMHLRPLVSELIVIGEQVKKMEEMDDKIATGCLQRAEEVPTETRLDRVRGILREGMNYEQSRLDKFGGLDDIEETIMNLANRINELAMRMMQLKAFRERQDAVFKVLAGIGR